MTNTPHTTRSSRVGKLNHPKVRKTIFYGEQESGATCGHQHTSARAAKHCIANHKRRNPLDRVPWFVRRVPAPRS